MLLAPLKQPLGTASEEDGRSTVPAMAGSGELLPKGCGRCRRTWQPLRQLPVCSFVLSWN